MRAGPGFAAMLVALLATSAAAPAPARAPSATGPFLPLSAADESRAEAGCALTFIVGSGRRSVDLLQLSGHRLLSRTRAGLDICPISETQFQAFAGRGGTARCGGRRIAIRSGPPRDMGSDSASSAATLTVTQSGRTQRLHGTWASAC